MTARVSRMLCNALLGSLLAGLALAPSASAAGELVVEPDEVSFGAVTAGEQRSLPLSVRNVASDPVTLGDTWLLYEEGATVESFSVDPGSCSAELVLGAGATCKMTATFAAPQQAGSFEAIVAVEGDGVDPAMALLSGQSVAAPPPPPPAVLVAEPSQIGFPRTRIDAVSAPRPVRVRNVGSSPTEVPPASVDNPHFGVVSNDCPTQLAPGAECTVAVVFKPTEGSPLPIGYLVGGDVQRGALAFGPRDPGTRRYALAVALSGPTAPRPSPPDPATLVGGRLASLADSVPKALRGGPRRGRLADFQAPLAGTLTLHVYGGPSKRRILVAKGRRRLAEGERHRLRFALTRKGRKLLSKPQRTRVKVVFGFTVAADMTFSKRAFELAVKAPQGTGKRK